uniref:Hyaluronan/mRNA-binding protein domain-containing protein n=1 Tax=Brassica oleracea TaxID=3712 RepID=A0A3P6ECR3_BRAOL|nr:unnamed protein product [Brassica oleracea]
MTTLNPFDLLDDGAEDPSQIAVSIAADKPKKLAPVSAVFAKSSVPSRQLAQPGEIRLTRLAMREARSDTPRGGGHGGGDGGFSRGRGGCNRDFRGGDGNSKPSEEAGVSKPLYEKRSVYGGARRGGGRRGEAGDGEHPRRTFEVIVEPGREGDIKSEEAGCGNWGTPGEEVVVVETEEVAGVETEKPAGDEVAADANKENTAEVEEQKESEDKGSDKDKRKDDKEEKVKKAVNINEFWKPGEGENYYRGGGRGGRGRGRGGRDGEGASGGGFDGYRSEAAPAVGDTAQFPSLGGK